MDIGKLKTVPVELSKFSNVVKKYVAEKAVYNELVKKVNAIQNNNTDD